MFYAEKTRSHDKKSGLRVLEGACAFGAAAKRLVYLQILASVGVKVENKDGVWVRLSEQSIQAYTTCPVGIAWSLQYHRQLDLVLLVSNQTSEADVSAFNTTSARPVRTHSSVRSKGRPHICNARHLLVATTTHR